MRRYRDSPLGLMVDPAQAFHVILDDMPVVIGSGEQGDQAIMVEDARLVGALAAAYLAGATAMRTATEVYGSPDAALARLRFRVTLASAQIGALGKKSVVTETMVDPNGIPSFIPFDPTECTPPGGFTDKHREGHASLEESLLANFNYCNEVVLGKVAAEMGYRYGLYLIDQGVEGLELVAQVEAFERKQLGIIHGAMESGSFVQPDQDDHAREHYLQDLCNACMPVWKELRLLAK